MLRQVRCTIAVILIVTATYPSGAAKAKPRIEWGSRDIVESRMPVYRYHRIGPEYEKPKDPKAPNPGRNFMIELTVSDEPPRLLDRLLARRAVITGRIADAPAGAATGSVWLEDDYGRIMDRTEVRPPAFAFELDASRCLGTGLYVKAELRAGGQVIWSGSEAVRMVPTDEDPWRDFILGVYNMGTRPGTAELFRQIGIGHMAVRTTNSPAYPVQHDLRFHASNIVYSLFGFYHRDLKRWRQIKAAQRAARGPIRLARHRCFSSPKEQKFITDILTAAAMRHRPYKPLFYGIGDEIGIGNMSAPVDLCASKWCLARFRAWLRKRYGSLERLNAEWATAYDRWDEVEMYSTWQALERAETGNFSPWADRLEFMDTVLAEAVALGAKTVPLCHHRSPGAFVLGLRLVETHARCRCYDALRHRRGAGCHPVVLQ